MANWFDVKNSGEIGEIYMYGEITDEKWYPEDVTPMEIKEQLDKLKDVSKIKIFANSPGGGVYAGFAIYNALKRFGKPIEAYIDGVAASIMSFIVLAADRVVQPSNALQMIHNPLIGVWGESSDLRKAADRLDQIKSLMVDAYKEKTGLESEKISEMMDEETWMTGEEALSLGFVDEVAESVKIAACYNGDNVKFKDVEIDLSKFKSFSKEKFSEHEPENKGQIKLEQQRQRHEINMFSAQL